MDLMRELIEALEEQKERTEKVKEITDGCGLQEVAKRQDELRDRYPEFWDAMSTAIDTPAVVALSDFCDALKVAAYLPESLSDYFLDFWEAKTKGSFALLRQHAVECRQKIEEYKADGKKP